MEISDDLVFLWDCVCPFFLPLLSLSFSLLSCSHRGILSALHFSPIASFDLCSPGLFLLISCCPSAFPPLFSCLSCVLFHYLMSSSAVSQTTSYRSIYAIWLLVTNSQFTTDTTPLLGPFSIRNLCHYRLLQFAVGSIFCWPSQLTSLA